MLRAITLGTVAGALFAAGPAAGEAQSTDLELRSSAFDEGESIPERYSAYDANISPDFTWSELPPQARSLALVMEDPDAPTPQPFVHWVIYNIPAAVDGLPEGLPSDPVLTEPGELAGTTHGQGGMGQVGYFGPRPPAESGAHRYIFTLYALDAEPDLPEGLQRDALLEHIDGHIVGEGVLMGRYERVEQSSQ